jgi:hypothetical protein
VEGIQNFNDGDFFFRKDISINDKMHLWRAFRTLPFQNKMKLSCLGAGVVSKQGYSYVCDW